MSLGVKSVLNSLNNIKTTVNITHDLHFNMNSDPDAHYEHLPIELWMRA